MAKTRIKRIYKKEEQIPSNLFEEATRADSSYYEDYQLRPYNPDELWQKKGNYDLFDEMIEDDQISSLLHLKKLLIIDSKWDIACENEEVKEFLLDNLINMPEGFEKNLYDILSGIEYGFSLTEKIFEMDDGKIKLKDLKTRPPHSFVIHQDEFGNIKDEGIQQYSGEEDLYFDKDKFIHFIYQKQFDGPYGRSELNKGVYTNWWSKNALIKYWNMFNERHGMPTSIGRYDRSVQDQKDNLKRALKNLQAKSSIVMPKEVEIMLIEAKGDGESFKMAIDYYNTAIARKMLIPDLLGYSGDKTSGGSFALGQEHFGIFFSVLETIRSEISRLINKEIIKPLVEWNFGKNEHAEFTFVNVDDNKKSENIKTWLEYVKSAGVPVSQEASDWFHTQIDAPLPEVPNVRPTIETELKKKESVETFAEDTEVNKVKSDFDALDSEYSDKLSSVFDLLSKSTIDQSNKIVSKGNIRKVSSISTDRKLKKQLFSVVDDMVENSWALGKESVSEYVGKFSEFKDWVNWKWEAVDYIVTEETAYFIKSARPIIADGIKNGYAAKKVSDQIKAKFQDETDNRINRLVRTMTTKSYSQARWQGFQSLGDRVKAYEYMAILDGRTSSICSKLDSDSNGVYTPEEAKSIVPPNHFNCRGILVPILFEEDLAEFPESGGMPDGFEQQGDFWKPIKN